MDAAGIITGEDGEGRSISTEYLFGSVVFTLRFGSIFTSVFLSLISDLGPEDFVNLSLFFSLLEVFKGSCSGEDTFAFFLDSSEFLAFFFVLVA